MPLPYDTLRLLACLALAVLVASRALALELQDCRLQAQGPAPSVAARCGRLELPENPAAPDGRRIALAIAVIPALSARAAPDPLVLIPGGPGQGARESFLPLLPALEDVNRMRDLVLVDQRGTGESARLGCPEAERAFDDPDMEPSRLGQLSSACLRALPGDPRFYTTSVAVRDLEAVRVALGYEKLNLYGASYGTRVAQHYLRRYPAQVRSLVLDGVVQPGLLLGPALALDAEHSLQRLFADCRADAACHARFGDPSASLAALRAELAAAPRTVRIPDPLTAEAREERFGPGELALTLRILSYSSTGRALLPFLLDRAVAGADPGPLLAQSLLIADQFDGMLALGMHNAVACTEDLPFVDEAVVDRDALAESYLGTRMLDGLLAMCAHWPRGELDPDLREALATPVPALLFSGEVDPVTSPANGEAALAGFSAGRHFVFPGQGHVQLVLRCAQHLMRDFLEAGSASTLDARCLDRVRAAPFFLGVNGASP